MSVTIDTSGQIDTICPVCRQVWRAGTDVLPIDDPAVAWSENRLWHKRCVPAEERFGFEKALRQQYPDGTWGS